MMNEVEDKARREIRKEAERIEEDALHSARAHYEVERCWSNCNLCLGIPATVLAALATCSVITHYFLLAGVVAAASAILTGLLTFLHPSDRASRHRHSGNSYNALKNDARIFRTVACIGSMTTRKLEVHLGLLNQRRNGLNSDSVGIPRWAYLRGKRGITAGEADYKVDS